MKKINTLDWGVFVITDSKTSAQDEIEFTEESGEEYAELVMDTNNMKKIQMNMTDDELINIDDI